MLPVRVLIADDEALIRSALRIFVDGDPRTTVVGEAMNGGEAVDRSARIAPDVILMDLQMPMMGGITATESITGSQPDVRVLALTTFSSERHVVSALRAGATGYLTKDTPPEQLIEAILDVNVGEFVLSPQISRKLAEAVRAAGSGRRLQVGPEYTQLTARELDIVRLLSEGMSNAEIGRSLSIAEPTVKATLGRIMAKWNVRDRVQVLIRAVQTGLVNL